MRGTERLFPSPRSGTIAGGGASRRRLGLLPAILLILTISAEARAASPCRAVSHDGARYTVCEADLSRYAIRLHWQGPDGQPYAHLSRLPRQDPATNRKLAFAINAGMFRHDLSPVGLYVENGREARKASTAKGTGNFHLKPNGIFYVAGGRAGVMETGRYLEHRPAADIATQSGPMLVIEGKLHPKFIHAEASRKYRDGVGVRGGRIAVFAVSEDEVSFAQFARFYRDVLKCPNALFLDGGSAPALHVPSQGRAGNFLPLGPMLAVYGP